MFKFANPESFFWPVKVELPISGGRFESHSFEVEFKRTTQTRIRELQKTQGATDSDVCLEFVKGWRGVKDEKGEEMPFSQTAFEQLIDIPTVAGAIVSAFFEAQLGGGKLKN